MSTMSLNMSKDLLCSGDAHCQGADLGSSRRADDEQRPRMVVRGVAIRKSMPQGQR